MRRLKIPPPHKRKAEDFINSPLATKPKKIYLVAAQCGHCLKPIYSDQKWLTAWGRTNQWKPGPEYVQVPVHKKCQVYLQEEFIQELMKDVQTLDWLIGLSNKDKRIKELEIKHHKLDRKYNKLLKKVEQYGNGRDNK